LTFRRVERALRALGFTPVRQRGSHVVFAHADGRTTVVPNHPGEEIGRGLLRNVIADVGVTVEAFLALAG
jgi:predicted RNA binding protein YcfA (HicA-like mRNA interferase family)